MIGDYKVDFWFILCEYKQENMQVLWFRLVCVVCGFEEEEEVEWNAFRKQAQRQGILETFDVDNMYDDNDMMQAMTMAMMILMMILMMWGNLVLSLMHVIGVGDANIWF